MGPFAPLERGPLTLCRVVRASCRSLISLWFVGVVCSSGNRVCPCVHLRAGNRVCPCVHLRLPRRDACLCARPGWPSASVGALLPWPSASRLGTPPCKSFVSIVVCKAWAVSGWRMTMGPAWRTVGGGPFYPREAWLSNANCFPESRARVYTFANAGAS